MDIFVILECLVIVKSIYFVRFLSDYLLVCRYFDPLNWILSQGKHNLHARLLGFLLVVYGTNCIDKKTGISETNLLIQGLVGKTVSLYTVRNEVYLLPGRYCVHGTISPL